MIIDRTNIHTFSDGEMFDVDDINSTFTEICDKFDAMLETVSGHYHDGTDSRLVYSGFADLTAEEFAIAVLMGVF
jgi:hypothetical protein